MIVMFLHCKQEDSVKSWCMYPLLQIKPTTLQVLVMEVWKLTHPQAIQDLDEFVSLHLQWMGAVRMRVHQLMFCEVKGICGLLIVCSIFLSAVWTLILMAPIHLRGFIGEQVM